VMTNLPSTLNTGSNRTLSNSATDTVVALSCLLRNTAGERIDEDSALKQIQSAVSQGGNINAVVNLKDFNNGPTVPVIEAAGRGYLKILVYLHEQGVDLNADSGSRGWTALMEAADKLRVEAVLLLRAWGLNPDLSTDGGWTPKTHLDGIEFLSTRYGGENSQAKLEACKRIRRIFSDPLDTVKEKAEKLILKINNPLEITRNNGTNGTVK